MKNGKEWWPINSKGEFTYDRNEVVKRICPPVIEIDTADLEIYAGYDGKIDLYLINIITNNYPDIDFPSKVLPKDIKNIIMNSIKGKIKGKFSFRKRGEKIGIYLI